MFILHYLNIFKYNFLIKSSLLEYKQSLKKNFIVNKFKKSETFQFSFELFFISIIKFFLDICHL